MRLFLVYAPGNFIEATRETPYFQIGESKYGKPILDRVITPATPLDEAAKCALVSMDSTLKSNLSVGLPLDLLVYRAGALQSDDVVCIDERNPYFQMIRSTWGQRLREVFESIDDPQWESRRRRCGAPAARDLGALRADEEDHHARREDRLMARRKAGTDGAGDIVFSHANGFPAGVYRAAVRGLARARLPRCMRSSRFGHDPAWPGDQQLAAPARPADRLHRCASGAARPGWSAIRSAAC